MSDFGTADGGLDALGLVGLSADGADIAVDERSVVDSKAARTAKDTRSADGSLLARSEYNYVWKSWGFAATNRVELTSIK